MRDPLPGCGQSKEGTGVSAAVGESSDHAIAGDHEIVHRCFDARKRREEARPEGTGAFSSIFNERIVVDVVDSHEAVHGIGIVVVQAVQVTLGKCAAISFALCHRASPFATQSLASGVAELRTPSVVRTIACASEARLERSCGSRRDRARAPGAAY
jgi:hypothetical protein